MHASQKFANSRPLPPFQDQHPLILVVILHINNRLLELPRRHLTVEQNVQLAITPPLQLRQPKERTRETNSRRPAPDISTLTRQIPPRRIQHLTRQVNHRDLSNIVRSSPNARRQRSQAHRAGFGNDGVGNGSEGSGIDEGDEDSEYRLRVVRSVVLRDRGADSEEDEEGAVCGFVFWCGRWPALPGVSRGAICL